MYVIYKIGRCFGCYHNRKRIVWRLTSPLPPAFSRSCGSDDSSCYVIVCVIALLFLFSSCNPLSGCTTTASYLQGPVLEVCKKEVLLGSTGSCTQHSRPQVCLKMFIEIINWSEFLSELYTIFCSLFTECLIKAVFSFHMHKKAKLK